MWITAGTSALLLTIVAAALIFTRTARFNDLLRVQIVSYLAQTYRGSITIRSIEGSIWGSLTLRDIELHHAGTTIASIPQLRVGYQILPALRGQIVVSYIDVLNPDLNLAPDPDGQWNLLAAIAQRQPSTSTSSPTTLTVALRRLAVEQARVTVTTAPHVTYRLTDTNISGTGHIGLSGQTFSADTIAFALSGPQIPSVRAQGAGQYTEAAQVATIKVPSFSIRTDHSRLDFSATLRDLSEKNLDATFNLGRLAAVDVNSIAPQLGLAPDVAGTIRVTGKASDLHAIIAMAAANARLKANLQADVARPEPAWKLDSQLAAVDLRKLLKRRDPQQLPAGLINATVHANGTGFSPAAARGAIDARVAGLGARGLHLGDLTLTAAIDHQVANLKSLLAGPGGRAQLAGRINIAKVPAYNLTLTLEHLRPTNVIKVSGMPPLNLTLTAALDGSGYQPHTMRARAQVKLMPSTVRTIRIDSGHLDAQLSAGIVRVATASLKAGDTSVDLNGQFALDSRRSGTLNYKLAVGQISQWLA
ncbi:MAG TPA: AsmA family protein, partial [Candidatus Binataceae bacterium]